MRSTASAGARASARSASRSRPPSDLASFAVSRLFAANDTRHGSHAMSTQTRGRIAISAPCEPSEVGDSLLQLRAGFGQLIGNDDAAFESVTERRPDERDLPHLIREPVQHIRDVCSRVDEIGAVLPVLENL